eukprot:TRINITY_DN40552_c0_g1_i1.p1 TRINITY_DN40552_c0_g1~~TRINITY_DN40552_c0_g1_i1.p1  ORF type:complete len:350 (-),score=60.04 TRINITY_DN40552_c0_g1_i1:59-1045(-)
MQGLEKLLGKDQDAFRLLEAARSVPDYEIAKPQPAVVASDDAASSSAATTGVRAQATARRLGGAVASAVGGSTVETLARPTVSKVAELEERVAIGLEALLRETRLCLEQRRKEETLANDAALVKSRRARVDAELGFWRGTPVVDTGASCEPLGAGEIARLREQLAGCSGAAALRSTGPSQLPEMVYNLLDSCRNQHKVARAMDGVIGNERASTAEGRVLAATDALGQLLLEVDRDVDALALALATDSNAGASVGAMPPELSWAQRLEATARAAEEALAAEGPGGNVAMPPPPLLESLTDQLETENELLQRAIAELKKRQGKGPSESVT